MDTEIVHLPKEEYLQMKTDLETLRHTNLYQRLLAFIHNVTSGKKYTRKDIRF